MKTVRFASVVARAGRPDHYLTWSAPGRDPVLRKAQQESRVMTVHQQARGARKDFGVAGLEPDRNAQYLIFPRSLRRFAGARIVGIDFALAGDRLSFSRPVVKDRSRRGRPKGRMAAFPGTSPPVVPEKLQPIPLKPRPLPPSRADIENAIVAALRDLRQRRSATAAKKLSALLAGIRA